jgi:hypothetical protein
MNWTLDELHAVDQDVYDVLVEELQKANDAQQTRA